MIAMLGPLSPGSEDYLVVPVFFSELLKWSAVWVGAWLCYTGNVPTNIIIQDIF